jgi:hypothetical protein
MSNGKTRVEKDLPKEFSMTLRWIHQEEKKNQKRSMGEAR